MLFFFYIKKNASQYHWLKDYILDYILVYNRTDRSQVILKFELLIKKKQILIIKFINETYEWFTLNKMGNSNRRKDVILKKWGKCRSKRANSRCFSQPAFNRFDQFAEVHFVEFNHSRWTYPKCVKWFKLHIRWQSGKR